MMNSIMFNLNMNNNSYIITMFLMLMFLNMSMLLSFIFLKINHPLTFIFLNIFLTIFLSIIVYLCLKTSLFSFIMFIIMIGGLMIIFLYFTSLINNEKSYLSLKMFFSNMIFMISIYLMFYLMYKNFNINIYLFDNELFNLNNLNLNNMTNKMNNMYFKIFFIMYILSIFMLMISLFNIIKICSKKHSSLRRIN